MFYVFDMNFIGRHNIYLDMLSTSGLFMVFDDKGMSVEVVSGRHLLDAVHKLGFVNFVIAPYGSNKLESLYVNTHMRSVRFRFADSAYKDVIQHPFNYRYGYSCDSPVASGSIWGMELVVCSCMFSMKGGTKKIGYVILVFDNGEYIGCFSNYYGILSSVIDSGSIKAWVAKVRMLYKESGDCIWLNNLVV